MNWGSVKVKKNKNKTRLLLQFSHISQNEDVGYETSKLSVH